MMEPRSQTCTDPELGRLVEPYLEGTLDAERREAFEVHYFRCPACLEEVELRQGLAGALVEGDRQRPRRHVWLGAATLAAAAVVGLFFVVPIGLDRFRSPHVIRLDAPLRSPGETVPRAPVGQPIELRLSVPTPQADGVRYALRILDPSGVAAFVSNDLVPVTPKEVRVTLPHGLSRSGRHEVLLEERVPGDETPLVYRFQLEIVENQ